MVHGTREKRAKDCAAATLKSSSSSPSSTLTAFFGRRKGKKTQPPPPPLFLFLLINLALPSPQTVRLRVPLRPFHESRRQGHVQGQARHLPLLRQRLDVCPPRRRRETARGPRREAPGEGDGGREDEGGRGRLEARCAEVKREEKERKGGGGTFCTLCFFSFFCICIVA